MIFLFICLFSLLSVYMFSGYVFSFLQLKDWLSVSEVTCLCKVTLYRDRLVYFPLLVYCMALLMKKRMSSNKSFFRWSISFFGTAKGYIASLSWYLTITLSFHSEQSPVWRSYNCISLLLMVLYIF